MEGYRPCRGDRHHQATLESLADTLGTSSEDIDYYLDLARMRHNTLYGAAAAAQTDVEAAILAALDLSRAVTAWLKNRGYLLR